MGHVQDYAAETSSPAHHAILQDSHAVPGNKLFISLASTPQPRSMKNTDVFYLTSKLLFY